MIKNKRGFSLVELTIVICIISLLTIFASFFVVGYLKQSKIIKTQANAKVIYDAVITTHTDVRTSGLPSNQKNYLDAVVHNLGNYLQQEYIGSLKASYKVENLGAYYCAVCDENFPAVQIYYPQVSEGKESVWNNVSYPLGIVYQASGSIFTEDDYNRKVLKGIGAPDAVVYNDGTYVVYSPFTKAVKNNVQDHYIQYMKDEPKSFFTWNISHSE